MNTNNQVNDYFNNDDEPAIIIRKNSFDEKPIKPMSRDQVKNLYQQEYDDQQ